MSRTRNVGILIFDEVEVLDFCGPFEVFSVAASRSTDEFKPFEVFTIGPTRQAIRARGGLNVTPHRSMADAGALDVLLVPGGQGTRPLVHDAGVIDWIRHQADAAELVLSVCTGALLLGKAGLLDGLRATTHHGALELLAQIAPNTTIEREVRFVDNGRVITSGGIAAGIDMSLHVVERLLGREHAQATARHMEYPWTPTLPNEVPA
jgi:transcriptional regulator GlxA family with amidase domain